MLLSDYSASRNLTLDEIQFITAIAVDNLGNTNAATAVLKLFLTDNSLDVEAIDKLEQSINAHSKGKIWGFIEALYLNKLFVKRASKYYDSTTMSCNITELSNEAFTISFKDLYNLTMKLITLHKPQEFIVLYAQTNMWQKVFSRIAANTKITNSVDVVRDLHIAFLERVEKHYALGYQCVSRTPELYLASAYNNFFINNDASPYWSIINKVDVIAASGSEDNRSFVDRFLDDDSFNENAVITSDSSGINFPKIAKNIYEASYSLFNHINDNGIAYYDILTWYKWELIKEIRQKNKALIHKLNQIYSISFEEMAEDLTLDTRADKLHIRKDICSAFSALLTNGVALKDIYPFYNTILEASVANLRNTNNGKPAYDYKGIKTKKGNNAERFQKQYEGFLALKELLDYLNTHGKSLGVSIFNFPVDVFRDKRLLDRFNTITEYISMYKDVSKLIVEVDSNSARKLATDENNLLINELVYKKLQELESPSFNNLLKQALGHSLIPIEIANKSFDSLITARLNTVIKEQNEKKYNLLIWQDYKKTIPEIIGSDKANYILLEAFKVSQYIVSLLFNKNATNDNQALKINYMLSFIRIIDALCTACDLPIEDNGISQITGLTLDGLLDRLGIPKDNMIFNGQEVNYYKQIKAVFSACQSVFANSLNTDLVYIFNIARILNSLLTRIMYCENTLIEQIKTAKYEYSDNYFLCYAYMIHEFPILEFTYPIASVTQVNAYLCDSFILKSFEGISLNERAKEQRELNNAMLVTINDYLKFYAPLLDIFNDLDKLAKSNLKVTKTINYLDNDELKVLSNLSARIKVVNGRSNMAGLVDAKCKEIDGYFDENGYLMKNGKHVYVRHCFIHSYGYLVDTGMKHKNEGLVVPARISEILLDDLKKI